MCATVPSVPRDFEVTLTQEDPPVATLSWRQPADVHGDLLGYRLTYGSLAADFVIADEKLLDRNKLRFTTGFLGQSNVSVHYCIALQNKFVIRQIQKCPTAKYFVHLKCTVK